MSCSASAFAMAAARAGTVSWAAMVSSALSRGASTCTRVASSPGVVSRPRSLITLSRIGRVFAKRRVRRGEVLRDEELGVVRVRGRQRLADDQRGLRLVDLLLEVADDERSGAGQHGGHHHQREPGPSHGDQSAEIHGASLSLPCAGGLNVSANSASRSIGHDIRDRQPCLSADRPECAPPHGRGASARARSRRSSARIWRSSNVVRRSRYSASSVSFAGRISSRYRRSASGPTRWSGFIVVLNLGQARDARPGREDAPVQGVGQVHVGGILRPRPDQGHLPPDDVDQLGELVDLVPPQDPAQRRHPQIPGDGHLRPVRASGHRPDLQEREGVGSFAHASSPVEEWSAVP